MAAVSLALVLAFFLGQAAPSTSSAGRVTGRVTAEGTNTPIAGARVMLFPAGPMRNGPFGPPPQTITDDAGSFAFAAVAPGDYRIDVQKTGFAPLEQGFGSGQRIQVGASGLAGLELRLQRGGVITGRVLSASGEPLSDLRIMALRKTNAPQGAPPRFMPTPMQGMQQTNDVGEYRVAGLPAGEYLIAATRSPGSMFGGPGVTPSASGTAVTTTYYPGTTNHAGAQPIPVRAGETVANIEFSMQSTAVFRVSGRVVDESGQPVAGAMVMLMGDPRNGPAFMSPTGSAQSGEDGRFSIAEVPAGAYRVSASVPIRMTSTVSGGSGSGGSSWVASGGGGSVTTVGGVTFGSVTDSVNVPSSTEVVVTAANVTGIRLTVHRPQQ